MAVARPSLTVNHSVLEMSSIKNYPGVDVFNRVAHVAQRVSYEDNALDHLSTNLIFSFSHPYNEEGESAEGIFWIGSIDTSGWNVSSGV
jgi:hypothetical protein